MNAYKSVLFNQMDAMSCDMDCKQVLAFIEILSRFGIAKLDKALGYERAANRIIEGQLKLKKVR